MRRSLVERSRQCQDRYKMLSVAKEVGGASFYTARAAARCGHIHGLSPLMTTHAALARWR